MPGVEYGTPTITMPRWSKGTIIVSNVVSWPPWVEAMEVKTPSGLPSIWPFSHSCVVLSIKAFIWAVILPKRVGCRTEHRRPRADRPLYTQGSTAIPCKPDRKSPSPAPCVAQTQEIRERGAAPTRLPELPEHPRRQPLQVSKRVHRLSDRQPKFSSISSTRRGLESLPFPRFASAAQETP